MKNVLRRFLSVWLCLTLLFGTAAVGGEGLAEVLSSLAVRASASSGEKQLDVTQAQPDQSGDCGANGDNVKWYWYKDKGLLELKGSGRMKDYSSSSDSDLPCRYNRYGIQTVIIETGITSIGSLAFCGLTILTDVTIPDSVTSIGDYAFSGCTSLASITIPDSVTTIGISSFKSCNQLNNIVIPNGVKSICERTFELCKSLTNVTIPNSVTSIGDYAFGRCDNLTSIKIPKNVISIGNGAFEFCRSLSSEIILDSVTFIGDRAFAGCENLKNVTIGDKLMSMGNLDDAAYALFAGCNNLMKIIVSEGNKKYSNDDSGVLYNKDKTTLLLYPTGNPKTMFVIPDSVKTIEKYAFSECTRLTSVTLPSSVTSIGEYAFNACWSLKDIYYTGNEADHQRMSIDTSNYYLQSFTVWHYNYVDPTTHTHSFDAAWQYDESNHWKACVCGETGGTAAHTFDAVITTPPTTDHDGVKTYTCTVCGFTKTETIPAVSLHDLPEKDLIRGNSADNKKEYAYRATVEFTANVPAGGSVQWYVDGQPAGNGATLTVEDKKSSYTVTVVVTAPDGTQTMDEEHVTIQTDPWSKIVWFFLHIFFPHKYKIKQ